jgi:hypothetical protein
MKPIIYSLVVLSLALPATAAQSLNTKLSGSYSSLRALGMGNAFTAVADDYSLLYYNPAGLARKPYNEVQVTLVGAGVSSKTLTIMDDIKKASDTPGTDNDKAQAVSDALENYYGQSLGGKLQALEMFWVRKGWGIGLIPIDLTIDMSVNRQLGPALDLNVKGDTSIAFGWGQSLNREVDIGVTAKFLHRVAVEQSVSALELATNSDVLSEDRFKEGTNLDFDIGFMWTPGWFAKTAPKESTSTVDTMAPAPATPDNEKAEPIKPENEKADPKALDPKPEETKPEEPRKPNAEGDATPVVADPAKPSDEVKKEATAEAAEADVKKADAPKEAPAEPVVTTPVDNTGTVKLGESKTEEKVSDVNSGDGYPLTLGMTVHNVIAGGFSQSTMVNKNATDVPTKIERTIDVGSQYRFYDGEDLKVRAMLDFHNILHPNVTVRKATHIGVEFDYSPSSWFKTQFRGGLNQMYMTAGATFLFGVLNIDLVTYGEEVGTDANKIENRVMAAKLGFNF